jgi:hypothetical protein
VTPADHGLGPGDQMTQVTRANRGMVDRQARKQDRKRKKGADTWQTQERRVQPETWGRGCHSWCI